MCFLFLASLEQEDSGMLVSNSTTKPRAAASSAMEGRPSVVRAEGPGGLSRDEWIDKIKESRRKWMVMLRRYSASTSTSASKTSSIGKLRQDGARRRRPPHPRFKMDSFRTNDNVAVPAADFCPGCESIVEVELEYIRNGDVVEHRGPCSMCNNSNDPLRLASAHELETLRSRMTASTDNYGGADGSLPTEKKVILHVDYVRALSLLSIRVHVKMKGIGTSSCCTRLRKLATSV